MSMEQSVECELAEETEILVIYLYLPQYHFIHHKTTWPDLGSNSSRTAWAITRPNLALTFKTHKVNKCIVKSPVFWHTTACSSVKVNRRFAGTLPVSSRSKSKPSKETTCFMLVSCLLYVSTQNMDAIFSSESSVDFHRSLRYVPPKCRFTFTGLHDVKSQKTEVFTV
jgi:hypothetical protein